MQDAELKRIRELIRTRQYVMTLHAEDEMDADGLTIYDVEHAVLTSHVTSARKIALQGEWKYLVSGESLAGASVTVVTKFGPTGKLVIVCLFRE